MTALLTLAGLALLSVTAAAQPSRPGPPIPLRPGMVITRSSRILPRLYRFSAPVSLDSAVVTVRGDDLTLDLGGATLQGLDLDADPDRAGGVAIRIEGGRNVRVVNGRIRGYKVALLASGTRGLVLANLDASYNWKPRLFSLVEHESLLDWLSFHHNEKNEWLRYGAGFYLDGVRGGEIRATIAQQGMNGLLLVRSNSLWIQDNDYSFNSGLGIGLYRSSHNTIVHNRLDFNVRGYSDRFYHRGQDSAGLLLYEQSSGNVVAWNSATHGGDGLFLWAGQSTMDTGEGGANDNVFYGNDFSFAPANAMEATFSRNSFLANRAEGSDYGLWGGYSYGSTVAGNCFLRNRTGIAIEHGQENQITRNLFAGDTTAINLWADPIEPSDWGYPKHRDTRSRAYRVEENGFVGNRVAIRARNTTELSVAENRFAGVDSMAVLRDTSNYRFTGNQTVTGSRPVRNDPCDGVPPLAAEFARLALSMAAPLRRVPSSPAARRDRSAIVVDQWGPFDWRSPKLWPVDSSHALPVRLRTLGPAGNWRVVSRHGIDGVTPLQGRIGDTLVVSPAADSSGDWELGLEFLGAEVRTPRGKRVPPGTPFRFSYGRFEPQLEWSARFFAWGDSTDLVRDSLGFETASQRTPLLTRQLGRLDLEWYRPQLPGLPRERWALEATTTVVLPSVTYQLQTISDDGIRLWVDGRLVIDRWTQHESALDQVSLPAGRHDLRVRFFQLDGWTELRVEILRVAAP